MTNSPYTTECSIKLCRLIRLLMFFLTAVLSSNYGKASIKHKSANAYFLVQNPPRLSILHRIGFKALPSCKACHAWLLALFPAPSHTIQLSHFCIPTILSCLCSQVWHVSFKPISLLCIFSPAVFSSPLSWPLSLHIESPCIHYEPNRALVSSTSLPWFS